MRFRIVLTAALVVVIGLFSVVGEAYDARITVRNEGWYVLDYDLSFNDMDNVIRYADTSDLAINQEETHRLAVRGGAEIEAYIDYGLSKSRIALVNFPIAPGYPGGKLRWCFVTTGTTFNADIEEC